MDENIFINLSKIQEEAGNLQDALTILTSAINSNPESANLRLARGKIYLKMGNTEAALFDAKKAAEICPEIVCSVNFSNLTDGKE